MNRAETPLGPSWPDRWCWRGHGAARLPAGPGRFPASAPLFPWLGERGRISAGCPPLASPWRTGWFQRAPALSRTDSQAWRTCNRSASGHTTSSGREHGNRRLRPSPVQPEIQWPKQLLRRPGPRVAAQAVSAYKGSTEARLTPGILIDQGPLVKGRRPASRDRTSQLGETCPRASHPM